MHPNAVSRKKPTTAVKLTMADPQTTASTAPFGMSIDQWRKALSGLARKLRRARKTCKHTRYKGFARDGRCCPSCGTFIVDFGD